MSGTGTHPIGVKDGCAVSRFRPEFHCQSTSGTRMRPTVIGPTSHIRPATQPVSGTRRWASAIRHPWDHSMKQLRWDFAAASALGRNDLIKLIRKLRWIGLEEEARQLQHTARTFHAGLFACESD